MTTLEDILDKYINESKSTVERGDKFERLVQAFLTTDVQWKALRRGVAVDAVAGGHRPRHGHRPGGP